MNKKSELICAHSALPFVLALGLGVFVIAGWLPPTSPLLSADEIQALFIDDALRIRIGVSVTALGSVLWWVFSAAITMQMRRMEGDSHPLTYLQMAAASGTVIAILLACYLWLAIAYRADAMTPDNLQLLNDLAWLCFVGLYPPGAIQGVSIGLCILMSSQPNQSYPRWVGYLCLWAAVIFLPGALLPFFHTGPFTWRGIIGFWLVAFVFFLWILIMWRMTVKAIRNSP